MSKVSLHPICIKNQDENNNILGLDTSELRFGSVQNLYLELETLPLTELFRSHHANEKIETETTKILFAVELLH